MAIYLDDGNTIVTQSMIRHFRRCPKLTEYKYVRRLKPRRLSKPLKRGSWFHALLETHYQGGDWRETHQKWREEFRELFDEEREEYGDLPGDMNRLMRSYLWHYDAERLKVLEVEQKLEYPLPDGTILRIKFDMLVEDQFGLWLWDHKTNKKLPDFGNRLRDIQSVVYVWVARKCGIPVNGFIWNYIRTEGLKPLEPLASGERISRWKNCDTDYPTAVRAIKKYELPVGPHRQKLQYLKGLRYQPGEAQRSTYFRREVLERDPAVIKRVVTEAYHTSVRMNSYFPQKNPDAVERIADRACSWCDFRELCTAELMGANTLPIMRNYVVADPMERYQDDERSASL